MLPEDGLCLKPELCAAGGDILALLFCGVEWLGSLCACRVEPRAWMPCTLGL
jgi:hypothetical protein